KIGSTSMIKTANYLLFQPRGPILSPRTCPSPNSEYEEINRLLGWLSIKSAVCSVFQSPSSHPSFRSSNGVVIWLSRILLSDNNWQSSNAAIPARNSSRQIASSGSGCQSYGPIGKPL